MSSYWSIDLGTTNSLVARWDAQRREPRIVKIESLRRTPRPGSYDDVAPPVIPSSVYLLPPESFWDRVGRWGLMRRWLVGRQALIAQPARDRDAHSGGPSFCESFKPYLLAGEAGRTVARIGDEPYSARAITRVFLRELFIHLKEHEGERPRDMAFTVPVDCYETYRAELKRMATSLGVRRFRTIDEPVAAAIGYGLGTEWGKQVMVIDFGAGTLDLAVIRMPRTERPEGGGRCEVLAKDGIALGGNHVDHWLLGDYCDEAGYSFSDDAMNEWKGRWWKRQMLEEACRVKETVYFQEEATFFLQPPDELRSFQAELERRGGGPVTFTRERLIEVLERNRVYQRFDRVLERTLDQAARRGVSEGEIDDILMVGGSSLLPGIYKRVEDRFGREKVRAWQPFEAVAHGAAAFSAGETAAADFITHDYAFVTYDPKTHEKQYQVVVPRGTPFPTAEPTWKRHLTPTCPLGVPEDTFKLVICEIGRARDGMREFFFDAEGRVHVLENESEGDAPQTAVEKSDGDKEPERLVVPLNEANPTLGRLNPPHPPGDRSPRLEVAFSINAEHWLCATVRDLKRGGRKLMDDEPVVRLR